MLSSFFGGNVANPMRVRAAVRSVEAFGNGVYKVVFSAPSRYNKYLPGQFLHLTLEEFDPTNGYWPESRVFSIASEPRKDELAIVYSVKGEYTTRMAAELAVGREVWLKYPYGDFIIDEASSLQEPLVMIAGGTGVSPYIPFLLKPREQARPIHLFYGVRQPEHLLFREYLEALMNQAWFHLHLFVEEGHIAGLPSDSGRLAVRDIIQLVDNPSSGAYYLSGPPAMIKSFQAELPKQGVSPSKIYIDEWE